MGAVRRNHFDSADRAGADGNLSLVHDPHRASDRLDIAGREPGIQPDANCIDPDSINQLKGPRQATAPALPDSEVGQALSPVFAYDPTDKMDMCSYSRPPRRGGEKSYRMPGFRLFGGFRPISTRHRRRAKSPETM